MTLSEDQIKLIIKDNPGADIVSKAKEYNKTLRMHLYGENLKSKLELIAGFEQKQINTVRAKYTKSNKDICSRLARPIDKIFSARGGSVYYNLSESQEKKVRIYESNVRDGLSVKNWIRHNWLPHFIDDPCGLIFMEIGNGLNYPLGVTYPTYKSVTSVYDYSVRGNSCEYIVFTVDEAEKKAEQLGEGIFYRVIDDIGDYYVKKEGLDITILADRTLPNVFGKVPAILNSDFTDPQGKKPANSFFNDILELLEDFLLKNSIKVTHDFLHGFPKYWQYVGDCRVCKGTTLVEGKQCAACLGTGKKVATSVSDAMLFDMPTKEDVIITPNVAGYVSPDKIYYEIVTTDLKLIEDLMYYTLWGVVPQIQTQGMSTDGQKTATQVITDAQPIAERLFPVSEMGEKRHKFIIDHVIQLQVQPNYPGANVNWGKRFQIESADAIWDKYVSAKKNSSTISVLDELLIEYYEGKYSNDPVNLSISLKLKDVEPFVHFSVEQVKGFNVSEEEFKMKLYYGEWLSSINNSILLVNTAEELRNMLTEFAGTKQLAPQQINESLRLMA